MTAGVMAPDGRLVPAVAAERQTDAMAAQTPPTPPLTRKVTPMRMIVPAFAMLAAGAAQAQTQTSTAPISIEDSWARATAPAAKTGAVYLTIVDRGAPDHLLALATPVAGTAELHETTMENNVMRMRPVNGLAVSAQGPVTLAPGGYHVMLMGLKQPLQQGQTFPLTLTFQHAGAVQALVTVQAIGAGGPLRSGAPGRDMDAPMPMSPRKQP